MPSTGLSRPSIAPCRPPGSSSVTSRRTPASPRLIVESGDDRTELDLAADARLFPAEPGRLAPTLSGEELAVDKVLAVFGRAEARDFVDLMALEPRYGLDRLCELAAEKDLGFTPARVRRDARTV